MSAKEEIIVKHLKEPDPAVKVSLERTASGKYVPKATAQGKTVDEAILQLTDAFQELEKIIAEREAT